MNLIFFTSAFCEPCTQTRAIVAEVSSLVPAAKLAELDVARDEAEAQRAGIMVTPTIIITTDEGAEVFRAEGVPTLNQVLVALAKAV
jgi:protein-disulfide isomerase